MSKFKRGDRVINNRTGKTGRIVRPFNGAVEGGGMVALVEVELDKSPHPTVYWNAANLELVSSHPDSVEVTLKYSVGHSDQILTYRNHWNNPDNQSPETFVARAGAELSNMLRLSQLDASNIEFVSIETTVSE